MYKVLLVDDERIIREGIAGNIDWEKYGLILTGTAANGLMAYEMILEKPPDIVIVDIKMPGMNGLELIARVKKDLPDVQFIVLSGYGEFDFAKTAMQYGVKYYLLKPCNENKIIEVITKVKKEIADKKARDDYINKIKNDFLRVMPQLKKQFLKEFVTNKTYGRKEWEYYSRLFNLEMKSELVRLILCQVEGEQDFEILFALKSLAEQILGKKNVLLSTTIGEKVLILTGNIETATLLTLTEKIKESFFEYYGYDATIAISETGNIEDTQMLFRETRELLKHRFYLGEGSIITKEDVKDVSGSKLIYDYDHLVTLVKSGNVEETMAEIECFFKCLTESTYEINITKTYCLDLFSAVIKENPPGKLSEYIKKLVEIAEMDTLDQIYQYMRDSIRQITEDYYKNNMQRHNNQINKVIDLINKNLQNEELSLKWLANEMLYMNVDYLGKLFKKEVGERFSDYVMRVRMEKAKELIEKGEHKIFEVAEKVGFGGNSQYFSQVFKKYSGYTPTEYKKLFACKETSQDS